MERPVDVRVGVKLRILNGRPHTRARGQMDYGIEFLSVKQVSHRRIFAKIDVTNGDVFGNSRHVVPFDLRIVKVVKIVEDDDRMSVP